MADIKQSTVMTNDDKRFYFILAFAVLAFVSGIILLAGIIFGTIPKENQQMANVALGFIMNTLIATVLLYFFGGNPAKKTEVTNTGDSPVTNVVQTPNLNDNATI